MTKTATNPKVDAFLQDADPWRDEIAKLRAIVLGFPLAEELKWSKPCYSFEGKNVAIIIPFKEAVALMFCKGALLKDAQGVLGKPGENSQASRWIKFTSVREITRQQAIVKDYIREAIEAEKAGLKVKYKQPSEHPLPEELKARFRDDPALKAAFSALTPGRQRGYLLFIAGAKQSQTRVARIEKSARRILAGKGMNE